MIELTAELQQAIDHANGTPAEVIDPRTAIKYRLVRAEAFQQLQEVPEREPPSESLGICLLLSDGIRRSKRALRRDLPELLRRYHGRYAAYHLEERIGISRDHFALLREIINRGIPDEEHIIEKIEPGAGNEEILEL